MRAVYVKRHWENEAQTIMSFYFKPESQFRYEAGQYTDIIIAHAQPDERGTTRTMTLSSSPHEELLCITTRVNGDILSTYKQSLLALRPGEAVTITDPMGDMILPLTTDTPLVFVAGGVGIASFSGIVRQLLYMQEKRAVTLLYAASSTSDMALQEVFDRYAELCPLTRYIYTPSVNTPYDSTASPVELRSTRLSAADIVAALQPESQIYLSGSMRMVESLRSSLETDYSIPQYRIVFDYFDGYAEA